MSSLTRRLRRASRLLKILTTKAAWATRCPLLLARVATVELCDLQTTAGMLIGQAKGCLSTSRQMQGCSPCSTLLFESLQVWEGPVRGLDAVGTFGAAGYAILGNADWGELLANPEVHWRAAFAPICPCNVEISGCCI